MPRRIEPATPIAARLRQLRAEAGLSQEQLASESEIARSALAKWEAGKASPSLGPAIAVARALAVHLRATAAEILVRLAGL